MKQALLLAALIGAFGVDAYEVGTHRFMMHAANGVTLEEARNIRDHMPNGMYGVIVPARR